MSREKDMLYMRRALQLARFGAGHVSPNPMVGAVIVANGRIIGEGFHRKFGGPHAEVNAVRSVRRREIIPGSTVYVTLEPCAHYGKTPPCAELLIRSRVGRVVIGSPDPFAKVNNRGIAMLREAGIEVEVGVLEDECRELNRAFLTAHTLHRPYVILKWAQSADGFIAAVDADGHSSPVRFSTPITRLLSHRLRSDCDAIMVGSNTVITDNPALTLRHWPGTQPLRIAMDRSGRIPSDSRLASDPEALIIRSREPLDRILESLYSERGITSLIVEGGTQLLNSFIKGGLADEARIEISPMILGSGVPAPQFDARIRSITRSLSNFLVQKRVKKT